jgi:hypothetical protein
MFEFSILCVIALAIGYWVALWLMGRHDDVLHGHFVHPDAQPEPQPEQLPAGQAGRADTLQALLATIKQDLRDAAQI